MFRYIMMFCAGIVVLSLALTNGMPKIASMAESNGAKAPAAARAGSQTAAQQGQPVSSGRQVTINANAQGHFESNFRINGSNVTAMIDTGATLVAINEATARRAGLNLSASDFKGEVQTANGATRAAPVMLESVQIGGITIHDVQAVVLADEALNGTLVGMSFLNRLKGFQMKDERLHLTQ